jgi:asparagine synthetase B (glutamine-hydrolysing)
MIRSNSFALLIGDGAEEKLRKRVPKVDRHCKEIEIGPADAFGANPELGTETAVAVLSTDDGSALPIVHGFIHGKASFHRGEFSLLTWKKDGYVAERDVLGTRQLYAKRGKLTGVASDFRFFDSGLEDLISPGVQYSLPSGSTRERRLVPSKKRSSLGETASILARLIDKSTRSRVKQCKKVGVAFSGGLDSSLLAYSSARHAKVTLCSVYVKGSKDERGSKRAADRLDLELVSSEIDEERVRNELRGLNLPFTPSPMDKALWCVYSIAGRMARERDADVLILGQLADELFGGYMKYTLELREHGIEAATAMMERDVWECSRGGFIRDETACSRWIEPRFPFADEEIVRLALGLPLEYKIAPGDRKRVLKLAALEMGLPEELVMQPKKAAQYSSGIIKLV